MRFFSAILATSFFFATFVSASNHIGEFLLEKRTADVCGCVDDDLFAEVAVNSGHRNKRTQTLRAGRITRCMCLSDVEDFCEKDEVAKKCSGWIGKTKTRSKVTDLIKNCKGRETCSYPSHCSRKTRKENVCDFDCQDGFVPDYRNGRAHDCICPFPKTVCGGQCGYHRSCQTQAVTRPKRDETYWGKQTQMGCQAGWTACGVPGGKERDWECVDTRSDLESCGGCTANLFSSSLSASGVDCTAIEGVANVACISGICEVKKCLPGYSVSFSGESCVKNGTTL